MRVLVAEDDERTASYLVRGLAESGHIADRAADGDTALAMALEGIYDALVLDRLLPGIDGVTVIRRLRAPAPPRPADAAATPRVPSARAPGSPCRRGRDAHHVAGDGLGL